MKGIFDHVIRNKDRLCITRKDQVLLYVRGEEGVRKSHVIHVLEIGSTLLNRRNELMISVPTGCVTKSIGGSMMYTALSISTCRAKSSYIIVSGIWTH